MQTQSMEKASRIHIASNVKNKLPEAKHKESMVGCGMFSEKKKHNKKCGIDRPICTKFSLY